MLFLENYVNVDTGLPIPSPISGADQKTRITPLKVAKLVNNNGDSNIPAEYQQSDTTLANKKGGYNLKVDAGLGTTDLSVGDLVMIMDDRIEDEVLILVVTFNVKSVELLESVLQLILSV